MIVIISSKRYAKFKYLNKKYFSEMYRNCDFRKLRMLLCLKTNKEHNIVQKTLSISRRKTI